MTINNERMFDLLSKIGFVRVSGSKQEKEASLLLKEELKNLELEVDIDPFRVKEATIKKVSFEVLEPYKAMYEVNAYIRCSSTNPEGLIADFMFVEDANEVLLSQAKGKFVLISGYMRANTYKKLIKAEVAGFITYSGTLLDENDKTDLDSYRLRDLQLEFGNIPCVHIRAKDAHELVLKEASKVRVIVQQEEKSLTSQNVYAEIPGTVYPEQIISFGAHYDSVPFSTGVYDNGAGTVIIMEILRYYLAHPPKRTLRFHWYGSEEVGLLGSRYYTDTYDLSQHLLMINVDVAGAVLGRDVAKATSEAALADYINYLGKEIGFPITAKQDIYSSDATPFADKGVPAVSFCRFGTPGAAFIHNRYDQIQFLSAKSLGNTAEFVLEFSKKMVNSVTFPVARTIPEAMKKKIDEYYYRNLTNE